MLQDAPIAAAGATLVLPAVAYANVGELAVDALIATLGLARVARLGDENVLSVVGNDPFDMQQPGTLATALELYAGPAAPGTFVLQQRAPAIPGRQAAFAESLVQWTTAAGFGRVLVLCGLDAQFRREGQIEGTQLRLLHTSAVSEAVPAQHPGDEQQEADAVAGASSSDASSTRAVQQPGATAHTAAQASSGHAAGDSGAWQEEAEAWCSALGVPALESSALANEQEVHGLLPPWTLLRQLKAAAVPGALLSVFASEGDNVPDALALARAALRLLGAWGLLAGPLPDAAEVAFKTPCSWAALYGRPLQAA